MTVEERMHLHLTDEQADRYLQRIGCERKEPSFEYLSELVLAHLRSVPFENLDVCWGHLTPSLCVDDLYDKVVLRRRGGYCFEQNGLFQKLLLALGFDASCVLVHISHGEETEADYERIAHRGITVNLPDGRRAFADVGYGGPCPVSAIDMSVEAGWQRSGHREYRVVPRGEFTHLEIHDGDRMGTMFVFRDRAADETEFIVPNQGTSGENAGFRTRGPGVSMLTPEGNIALRGNVFTVKRNGEETSIELGSDEEVKETLRREFGMTI